MNKLIPAVFITVAIFSSGLLYGSRYVLPTLEHFSKVSDSYHLADGGSISVFFENSRQKLLLSIKSDSLQANDFTLCVSKWYWFACAVEIAPGTPMARQLARQIQHWLQAHLSQQQMYQLVYQPESLSRQDLHNLALYQFYLKTTQ